MDNNYGQNAGNTGEQMNGGSYNNGQYYNSDQNYNNGQNYNNESNYNNGQYNYNYNSTPEPYKEEPMTVGQWMITLLVMMIPCVNIIMAFVWAFGSGNVSRKNYFKAYLIFMAIVYAIMFVLVIALSVGMASMSGNELFY